jgi:glycosyltransferase involved in cell wall biosynthesis
MLRTLLDRGRSARLVVTDTQRILDWKSELARYRRDVLAKVEALELGPHVEFRGVAYGDMPPLCEAADVVVYPTVGEEPYGLVPLEAMSCGRPVVASRSGGIPETVEDGVTGHIVPPGDADTLADRVGHLLAHPPLARALGAAGRRRVEAHFSADRYLDALLRRYAGAEAVGPVPS